MELAKESTFFETARPHTTDIKGKVVDYEFFVIIDRRKLERECFAEGIASRHQNVRVKTYESVEQWLKFDKPSTSPRAILIHVEQRVSGDLRIQDDLKKLVEAADEIPAIILGDFAEPDEVEAALSLGFRGYVPASVGLDSIVRAARLTAEVGGTIIPASSLRDFHAKAPKTNAIDRIDEVELTDRQSEVADALRQGKANKTIAYELQMCESTVKVHVRTIMKKLKATNRTQAAFILNNMLAQRSADLGRA